MPLFAKDSLETLKQKIDLIEVLSSYLPLKKNGAFYKTHCPFHEEKTPSFTVQKGDTHYHCYGCGAHGDAIAFVMQYTRLSFRETVELLAEKFRVPLAMARGEERDGQERAAVRDALELAATFYHTYLLQSAEGRGAIAYLASRALSLGFIRRFELGLAPKEGGALRKVFSIKGISDDAVKLAGLTSKEGRGEFFHDRITFPIRNASGAVVGFSARKYKEETFGGKYINSPETILFKKSRTLFGLNYARMQIAKMRKAIIVEGQIDALRLIEAGIEHTVAPLGTAFGQEHIELLAPLGLREAILLFDGDEAGQTASAKVGFLFQKKGMDVRVISLPAGTDPDSFIRKSGPQPLQDYLKGGEDYLTFRVRTLKQKLDMRSPAQKNELIQTLLGEIHAFEEPLIVHESLRKLAALTDVPEEMIRQGKAPPPLTRPKAAPLSFNPDRILELDVLRWLLLAGKDTPPVVQLCRTHLTPTHFTLPICSALFEAYLKAYDSHSPCDLLSLLIDVNDEQAETCMDEILSKKINRSRALHHTAESIQKLLDRNWLKERQAIKQQIDAGGEEQSALLKRFDELNAQRPKV